MLESVVSQTVGHDLVSCIDVRIGPYRKLSTQELMLLNRLIGKDPDAEKIEGRRRRG